MFTARFGVLVTDLTRLILLHSMMFGFAFLSVFRKVYVVFLAGAACAIIAGLAMYDELISPIDWLFAMYFLIGVVRLIGGKKY